MESIINAALNSLPAILALIQGSHAEANPGAPVPTDAEVIAALHEAVASVVGKGETWKAAHPVAETIGPNDVGSIDAAAIIGSAGD